MELPKNILETTKIFYDKLEWLKTEELKRKAEKLKRKNESQFQKAALAIHLREQKDLGNIMEDDYLKIYKEIALDPSDEQYVQARSFEQIKKLLQKYSIDYRWE